jgi:hypothetical protein
MTEGPEHSTLPHKMSVPAVSLVMTEMVSHYFHSAVRCGSRVFSMQHGNFYREFPQLLPPLSL